jgi:carbon-monoxide dehydrogenase small subunit
MLFSAQELLDQNPNPSDQEIRDALDGNLCRCTGYEFIVQAVRAAAESSR